MDYNQFTSEQRRLVILQALSAAPCYMLMDAVINKQLSSHGLATGHDSLKAELMWLNEQGLIVYKQEDSFATATLTARGNDVRQGLSTMPGVSRPEPL
jgi:hypothetical protein